MERCSATLLSSLKQNLMIQTQKGNKVHTATVRLVSSNQIVLFFPPKNNCYFGGIDQSQRCIFPPKTFPPKFKSENIIIMCMVSHYCYITVGIKMILEKGREKKIHYS